MSQVPSHVMHEDQAMATLQGPLEEPGLFLSLRSGTARYRRTRLGATQTARSGTVANGLETDMKRLLARVESNLARFREMAVQLRLQALMRTRRVEGVPDYRQDYRGFWGTIRVEGAWDTIFGGGSDGIPVFRRGIWESWSPELPLAGEIDTDLPMVLSPYCGTLLHEAVGHAMEAEYLGESPLKFHQGERVAHEELTVMDRPDLADWCGSMSHDDTGMRVSETTMIHRGILVGDLDHGKGVLRRASFRELPQVRASNFLIKPGTGGVEDWLRLPRCIYISDIRSGNWLPGSNQIKVLTGPLFCLERGEPVGFKPWAVLVFSTLQMLSRIAGIGKDWVRDPVVHWCMKRNQSVPFGMGGPSILLEEIPT